MQSNKTKICMDLLELVKQQEEMLSKQNEMIVKLTNENLEQENMINILMQQNEYIY